MAPECCLLPARFERSDTDAPKLGHTLRSSLPGRNKAGSSVSGLLVAISTCSPADL